MPVCLSAAALSAAAAGTTDGNHAGSPAVGLQRSASKQQQSAMQACNSQQVSASFPLNFITVYVGGRVLGGVSERCGGSQQASSSGLPCRHVAVSRCAPFQRWWVLLRWRHLVVAVVAGVGRCGPEGKHQQSAMWGQVAVSMCVPAHNEGVQTLGVAGWGRSGRDGLMLWS
jgi:hypothetical protein